MSSQPGCSDDNPSLDNTTDTSQPYTIGQENSSPITADRVMSNIYTELLQHPSFTTTIESILRNLLHSGIPAHTNTELVQTNVIPGSNHILESPKKEDIARPCPPTPTNEGSVKRVRACSPPPLPPKPSLPVYAGAATASPQQQKKPRQPSLLVESLPNWMHHINVLKKQLGHAPNVVAQGGKSFKFDPKSETEYHVIQRYLYDIQKTENISWFSYSHPADRSIKVAIHGIPVATNVKAIQEALKAIGFQPEYVRPIKARQGRPECVYLANLRKTPNIEDIFSVTELLDLSSVRIELWREKKGNNCHRNSVCVRNGEEHTEKDCTRPEEKPATCANGGSALPENKTACPVLREVLNKSAGAVAVSDPQLAPTDHQSKVSGTTPLIVPANDPLSQDQKNEKRKRKRPKKKAKKMTTAAVAPGPSASATTTSTSQPATKTKKKKNQPQASQQQQYDKRPITPEAIFELLLGIVECIKNGEDSTSFTVKRLCFLYCQAVYGISLDQLQ